MLERIYEWQEDNQVKIWRDAFPDRENSSSKEYGVISVLFKAGQLMVGLIWRGDLYIFKRNFYWENYRSTCNIRNKDNGYLTYYWILPILSCKTIVKKNYSKYYNQNTDIDKIHPTFTYHYLSF